MLGIDFVKQHFVGLEAQCVEDAIANYDVEVIFRKFDTEEEFKLELIEILKEHGYKFPKRTSLKKIFMAISDFSKMEEYEERRAKEDSELSELEEWQLNGAGNVPMDSDVDIAIDDMNQYDGFDIGDQM